MCAELASIRICQEAAGLAPHELMLGVAPGGKHERLLAKHLGARRSPAMARIHIVADLRAALARGAASEAADLLLALRRLLALHARVAPAASVRGLRLRGRDARRGRRKAGARGSALALASQMRDKILGRSDGV
jgi:enoyl-CoA hydratase/carnithine racemase